VRNTHFSFLRLVWRATSIESCGYAVLVFTGRGSIGAQFVRDVRFGF